MKSLNKLKTMVIGLDGANFALMQAFIKEKRLPTFKYLLERGAWGNLESTIPPITASAWTSFMTGKNPGKHGIVSFTKNENGLYSEENLVTTESFSGKTFFDVISNKGMKTGVISVPVTYPPWDINGIMISGYPCPDNDKIYSVSKGIDLNIKEPLNFSAEYYRISTEEQIIEDCLYRDKLRADLSFDLLSRYEFDCFVLVLGGIDRSQHDYWKYYDPDYPDVPKEDREKFKDSIYRNYKLADEEIARFLDKYGEQTNFFIISDHGAARHPFTFFNVNLWLEQNGWLQTKLFNAFTKETLKRTYNYLQKTFTPKNKKVSPSLLSLKNKSLRIKGKKGSECQWNNTKAFYFPLSYPAGGIMINLNGRQPTGIVSPGKEYEVLVNNIIKSLLEYHDENTGEKVVDRALRREEIYNGPYINTFPDIVYVLNPNYENGKELFGPVTSPVQDLRLAKISGLHSMDGIFIAYGPQIKPCHVQGSKIIDVAPTVLYATGLPIPKDMDGVVLKNIFKDDILKNRTAEFFDVDKTTISRKIAIESREKEQMKEKLRALGYIE